MQISTLTSKGQTTIPKEIREFLKLDTGDLINYQIINQEVLIKPIPFSLDSLKGIIKSKNKKSVSISEMNKALKKRFKK